MKGKFITFEGCEGVGKSTQAKLLIKYLEEKGYDVVFTREPGGTPVAERIREILLDPTLEITSRTEAHLFVAARNDHIENVILPNLEKGKIVICDRYVDSSIAYQGVARNLGIEYIEELNKVAFETCLPDCTVFINMDPANSWRKQIGEVIEDDRMESENAMFHAKCFKGFLEASKRYKNRYLVVEPLEDKMQTFNKILEGLKDRKII
ncbi:MAG TPA: dTMP kinase [Clostridiales bacterium]|nr:dTMP kinase [Clostridiales bacterium]